ncbi:PssD/Cps14F family polysaccharide biosynthesis glycosyltransferase [Paenibacillus sp. DMB20]|uniref:PssD/Cps14F family polysaccharide biosynthesis glycosyltransferase n=1 Tax=Paenibacillus sp. DMB20 TaxID=1642570 RepID=UPI002E164466
MGWVQRRPFNPLAAAGAWWKEHERFWVTFNKEDARTALADEKAYWCHHPTNRSLKNLIKNTFLAWNILRKEKPDILISSGAAAAVPFFYLGKLFGAKLVYIEVYDRISSPTVTGRAVYPITDAFIVQWEEQKRFYPKARFLGGLF